MALNRRTFLKLIAAMAGTSALWFAPGCAAKEPPAEPPADAPVIDENAPLASFMLLSDTHICSEEDLHAERFSEALRQIAAFDIRPDSIFIVGDVTNSGRWQQYDMLKKLIDQSAFKRADFTYAIGNHDQRVEEETAEEYEFLRQRFVKQTGAPALYYDKVIAGQHFIILGPDTSLPNNWVQFELTQEQLDWLDSKMAENDAVGAPSYVMCHEPIDGTITGALEGEWAMGNSFLDGGDALLAILKKHPNSVLVTGHSHIFPDVEASDPALPIFVNTGSVYRSYFPEDSERHDEQVNDGIQMIVYKDRLEFNIRNFAQDAWEGDTIVVKLDR